MALTDLDAIRDEISALFDGLVTANKLQANLSGPPTAAEIEGQSPLLSIHWAEGEVAFATKNHNRGDHIWLLTLFVNREGHGATASETLFLNRITAIYQALRDNVSGSTFAAVGPIGKGRSLFANIDGVPYRIAEIPIVSRTTDTS